MGIDIRQQTTDVGGSSSNHRIIESSNSFVILLLSVVCCLLSLLFSVSSASAQDLHFSQFFASPLPTSPSNTGFFNGDWRVGGNFKAQWPWAINSNSLNYRTFAAYTDGALLRGKLPGKDWVGIGFVFLNDLAGDGELKINKFALSLAYHKAFGRSAKYILSLGFGAGYTAKSIDYGKLFFNDQWDPNNYFFDPNTGTREPTDDDAIRYVDLSAGTHLTYVHSKKYNVSAGISFFHLNRPTESFPGRDNKLGIRPLFNAIGYAKVSARTHLEPGFMWMYQKKAQEFIINLLAGVQLGTNGKSKNSIAYIGLAGRPKDAIAPVFGYQYKTLRIITNYDINISSLSNASRNDGGFEVSVVYTVQRANSPAKIILCPRL